jgi:iron(III) transport system ATP-binding protein
MLKVQDLRLRYRTSEGDVEAVRGLSLDVERGEFYTLLGPSGCGKTSTLRSIAGLETPTSGSIEIDSSVVYSSTRHILVPPHKRNIGMVFQSYAIWPHMTVFDNVAFPLIHGVRKHPRSVIQEKVMHALGLVQLEQYATRPAPMLSGGQQQRVALARAIASEPALLLLDEPLSNLDARLRDDMRQEIKSLVRLLGTTTLYVTHDQLEALSMSDRIALLNEGRIVQEGTPHDVYLRPADAFAAHFLGRTNLIEGTVAEASTGRVDTRWGVLHCVLPQSLTSGDEVSIGFRPENVVLSTSTENEGLHGKIASATFVGDAIEYQVELGGRLVRARGQPFDALEEGQDVLVRVPPERCYILEPV